MTYRRDGLGVAQKNPQLKDGQASDPENRKQTNPLDADGRSETESSHD